MSPFSLGILGSARVAADGLPVTDSFTRADSSSLGNTETGQAWIQDPANAAGIDTNRLKWNNYTLLGGYRRGEALVETGATDVTVSAIFGSGVTGAYEQVVARRVDANNFYRLQHQNVNGDAYLIRVAGGVETVMHYGASWCPGATPPHPHSLTVREESGSTRIILHCDGVLRYSALDSSGGRPMGTRHGVILQTETSKTWPPPIYVDDFSVTSPAY